MKDIGLASGDRGSIGGLEANPSAKTPFQLDRQAALASASKSIARRSHRLLRLYGAFCRRDLSAHFHRIRLLGRLPEIDGPIVLCLNHPSWWDVEVYGWMGTTIFADRFCFAPMDAPNLTRYSILERFGAFAVHPNSNAGAYAFLSMAELVLQNPKGLLMIAVEGRYRDVRERPVQPRPGLAHLARRAPGAMFVPLALEYAFWSERRPNLLMSFGEPISGSELAACKPAAATARIAEALETTMTALAEAGRSRDPTRFSILLKGRDGMSGVIDLWRRVNALASGSRFQKAHRHEA